MYSQFAKFVEKKGKARGSSVQTGKVNSVALRLSGCMMSMIFQGIGFVQKT